MRSLIWLRNDLRTRDNTALTQACRQSDDGVVAVFAICAKQWEAHHWGAMKVDFVLRNLQDLAKSLSGLNIPLKLITTDTFDGVPRKLLQLATVHGCDALVFNQEYEVNETRRDRQVVRLFEKKGLSVEVCRDQVILDVAEIRTGTGGWYSKFTPFRRKWLAMLEASGPPASLRKPRRQKPIAIESDQIPDLVKRFAGHRRPDLWPAGETAAKKRLTGFVAGRIDDYHTARDVPAIDGTSVLSPYLAAGVISPRMCMESAMAANHGCAAGGRAGVDAWITELIWREFYRHILMGFPRVCMDRPFRETTDELPWRHDEALFEAWAEGRTGIPIVDAGMRQLADTGWMHNRLRMIVAMFLTKDLFIDWRWGERYFMRHLVDGDFASNNGGWQWSASTGTDAVPYFRIFNPFTQSRRFDPEGAFIRRYVPELAELDGAAIHQPTTSQARRLGYPQPIVDRSRTRQHVVACFKSIGGG